MSKASARGRQPKTRLNAVLYAMALEELIQGPTTRAELQEHTGLSRQTILSLVTALRKRKLIHIASWERDSRGKASIAAFAFGDKPDARRPRPLTNSECTRAWKERKRMAQTLGAAVGAGATV